MADEPALLAGMDEPEKSLAMQIYLIDGGGDEEEEETDRDGDEMKAAIEEQVTKRAKDLAIAVKAYIEAKFTQYDIPQE